MPLSWKVDRACIVDACLRSNGLGNGLNVSCWLIAQSAEEVSLQSSYILVQVLSNQTGALFLCGVIGVLEWESRGLTQLIPGDVVGILIELIFRYGCSNVRKHGLDKLVQRCRSHGAGLAKHGN